MATPLDWNELGRKGLSPRRYHLRNLRRRLARKNDPFADLFAHKRRSPSDAVALQGWQDND